MKYYIIAGERSGDLHASNLVNELKIVDSKATFRGFGGEMMNNAGVSLVENYESISFMGFLEVITHLPDVLKMLKLVKSDILQNKPDVVILVDFAGFNMRIAKFCKAHDIKVHYYISPKIWAWNTKRVEKVKKYIDKMYCILPFEKDFYESHNYKNAEFVGNPIFDAIHKFKPNPNFREQNEIPKDKKIIAVLPGSRKGEVENMLMYMLSLVSAFPDYKFVVAAVSNLSKEFYNNFENRANIQIIYEQTYDLLAHADAALVTSGTATLETALFNVPQVVCYKTSNVSYLIGRMVIKVKFISLVNLIAGKKVVTELIQDDYNPKILRKELECILSENGRKMVLDGYKDMIISMNTETSASNTTAELIYKNLH